jgi:hypothetical protein
MAVLKHPNLAWNNGTAPNSFAELVPLADIDILFIAVEKTILPLPDLASGGEDDAVGYAS